jgi:hypothetical protein
MGLAIENRARRQATFWAEHLDHSRAAQARWTLRASGEWLTVLGAGRLLDFNRSAIPPRFANLRLVDADPLCPPIWRNLAKPVEAVCADVSGCLNRWIAELNLIREPWPKTLAAIRGHRVPAHAAYRAPADALLSLNILSQLQIVWQDGVEDFLIKRFGRRFVEQHEHEWLDALRPAGQTLVEQHLAAIEDSGPRFALLITDLEYLEYEGRTFRRGHWSPPPVAWSSEGWRADSGVTCEVSPALEGVELNEAAFARWLPSYRLAWRESWLWHIAPLGTEKNTPYGKVHRVGAFALVRTDGARSF